MERALSHAQRGPRAVQRRLEELEREWDIERVVGAHAASLALIGTALGATVNRRWLLLPGAVGVFLLQHALQGWCPALPFYRRMGFRTAGEIQEERDALRKHRGEMITFSS